MVLPMIERGLRMGHARPPARLLDLTRLLSRAGRGPLTGVDRVELAYLRRLLQDDVPVFALLRASPVDVLLDRAGMEAFLLRITGEAGWGRPDLLARVMRHPPQRQRALSDVRRLGIAWTPAPGLGRMLARHLPVGTVYLNTGHSNLKPRVLQAVRQIPGARIVVFLHDTIPVDFPQFSAAAQPARFAGILREVSRQADLVIYNSDQSRQDAARHFEAAGRVPPALVAHLAVELPRPDAAAVPQGLPLHRPTFVTIGTIEPRKNHALLLDIWERLDPNLPEDRQPVLLILGSRGWNNEALFARLDQSPMMGKSVFELPGLSDGAVAALLQQARALLFPSLAEGFGLPVLEAAVLGTPVIANDLPIYREFAGDYPIYLDVENPARWQQQVEQLARENRKPKSFLAKLPTWEQHFTQVFEIA